jgi:hypothetical protein
VGTGRVFFEEDEGGRAITHGTFRLRVFRHCIYGEKFEVIRDHIALTWLLALRGPKKRFGAVDRGDSNVRRLLHKRGDGKFFGSS